MPLGSDLFALPFIRVLTTPEHPDGRDESALRRAILAGLLDAGVQGAPVAALWLRPEPEAALHVLVAGALVTPPDAPVSAASTPLLFPLGATGHPVHPEQVQSLLASFTSWVACGGGFDPLLADIEEQGRAAEQRWSSTPLDDVVGYLSHRAFAWLVRCDPVPAQDVAGELDDLRRGLFRLRQTGKLSEADVVELERGQAWFRELSRAGHGGVWDVRIAVGTASAATVGAVASVLCSAAERSGAGYRLRPDGDRVGATPAEILRKDGCAQARDTARFPFRATAELAAALVRPPETELPGVRVVAPPVFDTTPEVGGDRADRIALGAVLDRYLRAAGELSVGRGTLNRHTFVCGATGGGKSQTVRSLLESLTRQQRAVPWLVIEPAKAEYARMAGRIGDVAKQSVLVVAPGDVDAAPASVNPLEPASLEPGNRSRTFPLQSHADLVRALFLAAFQSAEPFPQVLSRALTECYEAAGWDLVTGDPLRTWSGLSGQPGTGDASRTLPRYPTLGSLQRTAQRVVEEIGYGDQVKNDVRGFVDVRIGSLRLGAPGRFFEGGHPLDFAAVLERNVVFELEALANDEDKAFVMGALLIRLYEQLLLEERERFTRERAPGRLRHVTVVEEAHRLLRNVPLDSPAAHSLELFASLLAEVRAYGEGIVIAEQIPSKLIPDVIKNTALKIVHRLPAADDREAVGATMNLSQAQSAYVVTLDPGTAAVFADGMDRPVLARMPTGEQREDASIATRLPPVVPGARRSRSCGTQCREGEPCSLAAMRRAERLVDAHPELTFWTEMCFATHALGLRRTPSLAETPQVNELRALGAAEPRTLECAIAHAVERAVGSRYDAAAAFYDPEALGLHVTQLAAGMLLAAAPAPDCDQDDGIWRLGLERFADVAFQLRALLDGGEQVPVTQAQLVQRAAARGLELGSGTPEHQLRYLESLPWSHYRGDRQRALLTGTDAPSRAVAAAAAIAGPGEPEDQLTTASARVLVWASPADAQHVLKRVVPRPTATPGGAP